MVLPLYSTNNINHVASICLSLQSGMHDFVLVGRYLFVLVQRYVNFCLDSKVCTCPGCEGCNLSVFSKVLS